MKKEKIFLLTIIFYLFICVTATNNVFSQTSEIKVKLHNTSDTMLFLAHYMGNKQFVDDTAYIDNNYFIFKSDKPLEPGMYIIAGQKSVKYFDFFVGQNDDKIEIECNPYDITNTIKVKNSLENKIFYDYVKFIDKMHKEVTFHNEKINKGNLSSDSTNYHKNMITDINNRVIDYVSDLKLKNPELLSVIFINSNIEPDYSKYYLYDENGKIDSVSLFFSFKNHYLDNFPFDDERMLYTPNFIQRIDNYFEKLIAPHVDSICKEVDYFLNLPNIDGEVQKYLAWHLLVKYETSKIMGFDKVFVHIVENYLRPGKIQWYYNEVAENVLEKSNILKTLLIGEQAPNLILLDTANTAHSIYDINTDYLLIFFWSTDCGHCTSEVELLLSNYKELKEKYNLEVYGICTNPLIDEMKNYIKKYNIPWINVNGFKSLQGNYIELYDIKSTPIMYLLDKNKKIVTRQLLTKENINFLKNK